MFRFVVGNAPGWAEPISRIRKAHVVQQGWQRYLVDEQGFEINVHNVQLARLAGHDGEEP